MSTRTDFKNEPISKSVSFYQSSGSIKYYRFHICHNQFKNDAFPKSRSICQHFHSCQLSNVNLIDTASNFRWNDLNLPQSLNFSFRSSNSCWAYSYNSISSEFIARILNQKMYLSLKMIMWKPFLQIQFAKRKRP